MTDQWEQELVTEREMKDGFMARHPESPFIGGRVPFHDLRYFPPDPAFRVPAKLARRPVPEEAYLRTNRDNQAVMRYLGDLEFRLGGRSVHLRVYHAGEGVGTSVFVPFRDRTSGKESYGPGRYLTLELNESDEYELDFNRAFNPYCAYTDDYECGFPPSENDLPVAVRAGEMAWAADRNPRSPSAHALARRGPPGAAAGRAAAATTRPRRRARSAPSRSRPRRSRTGPRRPRGSARGRGSSPSRRRAPSRAGSPGRSAG
jgi:uncharacterized protein